MTAVAVHPVYGTPLEFLTKVASENVEKCVEWPFRYSPAGYAWMCFRGKEMNVARAMCYIMYGEPLAGFEAAHNCGNKRCINHRHLRWAAHIDNEMDKRQHGTLKLGSELLWAKLDEPAVLEIKGKLDAGQPQVEIAAEYGVTQANISSIKHGKSWGWLTAISP